MIRCLIALMILLLPWSVRAQNSQRLEAMVVQLAGQHIYLDAGSEDGISTGDTLVVLDAGDRKGRLRVLAVASRQCIAIFTDAPFAVTRGQRFELAVIAGPRSPAPETSPGDSLRPASLMEKTRARPNTSNRRASSRAVVDGTLLFNLYALGSETRTRAGNVAPVQRFFLTPSVHLNATVRNLPSDVRLRVQARSDYRYQSRNAIAPTSTLRAYQLSMEKNLAFGSLQAGRFYHRWTQRGGYWDGVSLLVGDRNKGFGGAVGFLPDRFNEAFSTRFPRFSVFGHFETPKKQRVRYRASLTYNQIQPASVFHPHHYAGLEQRLDLAFLSIDHDLQIDRDPTTRNWVVSSFLLSGRLSLNDNVSLRGRLSIRQPYRIYSIDRPFLTRRDTYSAGIYFQFGGFSAGGNYDARYLNQNYEGRTWSGFFQSPPLTRLQLSVSGTAYQWASDFGDALYVNAGAARSFGHVYARADYGFYRTNSPNFDTAIDMHRYGLSATLPLGRRILWTFRGTVQQSRFLNSVAGHTSLRFRL